MHGRWIAAASLPLFGLFASDVAAQSLETAIMPGQVIAGHAKLESECKNCHVRFNKSAQTGLCLDCHKDVARDAAQRKRYHGRLSEKECRVCHTDHKGRGADIAPIDPKTFDHRDTEFPLRGAHGLPKVECKACHVSSKKFREAPGACNGCHEKDDKHKGKLGKGCADCHSETDWKKTRFDHGKTRFPLRNSHVDVPCKNCHEDPGYKGARLECVACHKKDDDKKGHKGKYGAKCESCHTDKEWKSTTFDHGHDTKYPLKGLHQQVKCQTCHRGTLYAEKLPKTCVACHRDDDMKKGHQGKLGEKCESCHTEKGWTSTTFNHDRDTKYPLKDKHADATCKSCHKGASYKEKLPATCVGCHREDDMQKGHRGRFGEKCESCHVEKGWKSTIFNHDRDTKFPLKDKHAQAKCASCHTGILYKEKLAAACLACHEKDDAHKGQLGRQCESCHNERDWKQTRVDHGLTRFPLLGKHAKVKCKDCHSTPRFKDTKTDCYACHRKDDKHKLRLGTRCEQCHNARDWKRWDFNHDRRTHYVLDGKHRGLDCLACHRFPMSARVTVPSTCVACHDDVDVHNGGFGRQCERCHVTSSFKTIKSGAAGRLFQ